MVWDRLTGFQFSGIHLEEVVRDGHPPSSSRTTWTSSLPGRCPSTAVKTKNRWSWKPTIHDQRSL